MNLKNPTMKVLLMQYSHSGETHKATEEFTRGMQAEYNNQLEICHQPIQLNPAFCFPWKFWAFFDVMPETVVPTSPWRQTEYQIVEPEATEDDKPFDLVVLGWQTWYLSPSLPVQLALENPKYRKLLSRCKGGVVLVGTHRNMWHHASQTLCQTLQEQELKIVGRINFVQSSAFLASVVHTLQRQLQGKPGLQTTAQQDAYREGRNFARHYQCQNLTKDLAIYQGGKPPNKVLAFCEDVWFPCKRAAAKIMSVFRPGSLGRKVVSLLYIPVLLSAIVGLAPPILLVGSLVGFQQQGTSGDATSKDKKEN